MPRETLSIIICTRDRAESLKETIRAVAACSLPADLAAEVLVVDNGSLDRTRAVVRRAAVWGRAPRYLYEPRPGVCYARNTAMAAAHGKVLLWADDDVRPGGDWIEAMCRPIFSDQADAVAGRIELPDYLERPWLRPWHRVCLAVNAATTGGFNLIGANMAFARRVLEKVPAFDLELGPGTLGFCDDTLFSFQLRSAGFRLADGGEQSSVEHHCGEQRLTRSALADVFIGQGRSQAYVDYHWKHRHVWFPTFRSGKSLLGLSGLRMLQQLLGRRDPVISRHEARWLWRWAYYRQLAVESQRPHRYERLGLEKMVISFPFGSFCEPRKRRAA